MLFIRFKFEKEFFSLLDYPPPLLTINKGRQEHRAFRLSTDRSSSTTVKDHNERVRRSRDKVVEIKMLTTKLLPKLSETVDAGGEFFESHIKYFQVNYTLRAIETTFFELVALERKLKSLADRCDDFAHEVSF